MEWNFKGNLKQDSARDSKNNTENKKKEDVKKLVEKLNINNVGDEEIDMLMQEEISDSDEVRIF